MVLPGICIMWTILIMVSENYLNLFITSTLMYTCIFTVYFNLMRLRFETQLYVFFFFFLSGILTTGVFVKYFLNDKKIKKALSFLIKFISQIFIFYSLFQLDIQFFYQICITFLNFAFNFQNSDYFVKKSCNWLGETVHLEDKSCQINIKKSTFKIISIDEYNEQAKNFTKQELNRLRVEVLKNTNNIWLQIPKLKEPNKFFSFIKEVDEHVNNIEREQHQLHFHKNIC